RDDLVTGVQTCALPISRRGWRVTPDSLGRNPFTSDINESLWKLRDGRRLSLRAIAAETLRPFRQRIRQIGDSSTLEHIAAVFAEIGRASCRGGAGCWEV